jgi:hypothetical protein
MTDSYIPQYDTTWSTQQILDTLNTNTNTTQEHGVGDSEVLLVGTYQ